MDGFFWVILLFPIIAAIGWSLQASSLQSKFSRMGTLRGRTRNEIIAAVGQPNSVSSIGPNQMLMQWQTTGYHIALIFTGEVCNGISHEYSMGGSSCAQSVARGNSGDQEKKQLDYERKYQEEKELYERTGKVSDWDKEGRALFDFEIRAKQLLEQQEKEVDMQKIMESNVINDRKELVSYNNTRKCPFCAEEIKEEAVICRFCNRDVPSYPPTKL